MSEIFSWLKRAEVKSREIPGEKTSILFKHSSAEPAADVEVGLEEAPPEKLPVTLQPLERFDLRSADSRVKVVLDPMTVVGEQYRLLRAKLSVMQKQKGIKRLLITSAVPDEGKTFTACCLAGVLAQEPGKRVLLIDADLRKATARKTLGLKQYDRLPGLCQMLRGEVSHQDAMIKLAGQDLWFLPAGQLPHNPAELLSSPSFEESLRTLSSCFDWIVLDSPPMVALADGNVLAPLCDAVLLIVEAGRTPVKHIKHCIQSLGREKICGIVMNKVSHLKSSRYYRHYYRDGKTG